MRLPFSFLSLLLLLLVSLAWSDDVAKLPPDAARALEKADADIAKIEAKAKDDENKIRGTLILALSKVLDATTKKGDLNTALVLKSKIAELDKAINAGKVQPVPHSSKDVVLYPETNYGGQGVVFKTFNTITDAVSAGFPNDGLRSIRVPAGVTVVVYENELGGGASQEITCDQPEVTGSAALGMSSFKIIHSPQ